MLPTVKKLLSLSLLAVAFGLLFTACDDTSTTGPGENESQLKVQTAVDIPASPTEGSEERPNKPTGFTFYNLEKGEIVAAEDSATTSWDIALSGLTILTNSGTSGPGKGGAVILDQSFAATTMAPLKSEFTIDSDTLKGASDWYDYDRETHVVRPLSNKTIVVRTADDKHYAKIKILSYYKGNPDMSSQEFQNDPPPSRYYTFKYAIQLNGTRDFK